ncbi:NPCBM/NEW2 domain-containing protein [Gemmata sp. G18]|uniref:NPCBM/NEW2 domain-containing protein n=1 Tax=Gemmata palustris TaxID=2822762 RepID=A0ABS5BN45_9BACT|nr:NPCBM/NEW2 domain-containing protein [Gemmata palustris]MBP3955135.1 NPCBM/NEW2 domain-containing protein [Gemmata palustris]
MRFPRRAVALAAGLTVLALTGPGATGDDVTTSAGKKLNGKLVAVDAQGVMFAVGESKAQIPARDIVVVDLGNKVAPVPKDVTTFSEIELTDGSTFRVVKFSLKDKQFEADPVPGPQGLPLPKIELPMGAVFSAMKRADDAKVRDAWKKMLANRGKRDLYVIAQETGFTYIQGTVLSGTATGNRPFVTFEKEGGGKDELPLSRAAGLVFYQPQPPVIPATLCKVTDVFGNALTASAISIAPEGVSVTTVAGATIKYASTAALVKLDYALGNVAYLSDLDPQLELPEVPLIEKRLNPTAAYLKDRSLSNETIKLENQSFPKGVCIAPETVATFNLGGDYTQFKATVGIDENGANATSAARVTIEADGQVLFTEQLKRKDKPKGLVLAVKGVKQLRIIVEADTPLNGNYVTLAEARVQK